MARWAERMFWATIASIFLAGGGFILLMRTLYHTRRSADAAHDANRPWIEVVVTEQRSFRIRPELARIHFMVSLKNRGNSPGTAVRAKAVLVATPEEGGDTQAHSAAIRQLEKMMDSW